MISRRLSGLFVIGAVLFGSAFCGCASHDTGQPAQTGAIVPADNQQAAAMAAAQAEKAGAAMRAAQQNHALPTVAGQ